MKNTLSDGDGLQSLGKKNSNQAVDYSVKKY